MSFLSFLTNLMHPCRIKVLFNFFIVNAKAWPVHSRWSSSLLQCMQQHRCKNTEEHCTCTTLSTAFGHVSTHKLKQLETVAFPYLRSYLIKCLNVWFAGPLVYCLSPALLLRLASRDLDASNCAHCRRSAKAKLMKHHRIWELAGWHDAASQSQLKWLHVLPIFTTFIPIVLIAGDWDGKNMIYSLHILR